ncbi:MAG: hypothetical protein QM705_14885 [Ancrocorticia sp.]
MSSISPGQPRAPATSPSPAKPGRYVHSGNHSRPAEPGHHLRLVAPERCTEPEESVWSLRSVEPSGGAQPTALGRPRQRGVPHERNECAESGQALPSFVMVAPLLLLVSLALLGLAMALHARVIVLDSAAEGARFGTHTSLDLARSRTSELIGAALPREYGEQVSAVYRNVAGVPVVEVSVVCPIPMLGMLGPATMEVRAHAAVE